MDDAGVMDKASANRALKQLKKRDKVLYNYAISFKCKMENILGNFNLSLRIFIFNRSL